MEAPGHWGRGDDEVDHGSVGYKHWLFSEFPVMHALAGHVVHVLDI